MIDHPISYAQKAIQYGVVDYVIKSNPLDKIREAVIKAISQIEAKKKQEHMITALEEKVAENLNDLQSKFLIDLINNSFLSEDEKRHKAEAFHIHTTPHFTLVFKIIPNENCIDDEARNRFLQSLNNFLMLSFKEYSPKALVLNSKTICLVVHLLFSYTESIKIISDICHQVIDMTDQLMHFSMKIGISNQYDDIFQIDKSFKEAYQSVSQSSDTNSSVIFYYPEKESQQFIHGERNVLVEQAKEYIKANFMNKIELQDIAGHVHLNPSYLSRTFKRVTGDSIVNYITKYIEKSKEMLTSSDCKLLPLPSKSASMLLPIFRIPLKRLPVIHPRNSSLNLPEKVTVQKFLRTPSQLTNRMNDKPMVVPILHISSVYLSYKKIF